MKTPAATTNPKTKQPLSQQGRGRRRLERVQRALSLAGAWSDMDFDEMLDALDRIRHESEPTPPIDLPELDDEPRGSS